MRFTGLARVAVTAVMAGATALAVPAAAQAAVPVGGGTPILVGGVAGCTLTAAGYDATGASVAFTAAHCSDRINSPVILRDDKRAGVIGTVATRNEILDYSVIRLDPRVAVPVRQPGVTGTGPAPEFGDVVCKDGLATGHTCGITWQREGAKFWSQACAGYGDSGGPIIREGRLVGLLSGGHIPPVAGSVGGLGAVLPSCLHPAQAPFFLPALAYSFETIVADATDRNWPGAGFRMA
ncbi:peptidase S1 [Rhodococcus sp. IEGM 1408]|uniref:peptidase S1 n=1 Tax=Rhodococcus sp. IEGM 1408 TaxID=3082220 RepID=UPI00295489DC|nr:peptidase S1 [Rhodococcus sp. IEGM 1408]MDV8000833.1 peptidase S1 [Rhodococcus sp. IEGM 1408]